MTIDPISLESFRASRQPAVSPSAGAERIRTDDDFFEGAEAVIFYDNDEWMARKDTGAYWTHVGNVEKFGTQAEVKAFLFHDFYLGEVVTPDDLSLEEMTTILKDYCDHHQLPHASADELLLSAGPNHKEFLSWFGDAWEEVQDRQSVPPAP